MPQVVGKPCDDLRGVDVIGAAIVGLHLGGKCLDLLLDLLVVRGQLGVKRFDLGSDVQRSSGGFGGLPGCRVRQTRPSQTDEQKTSERSFYRKRAGCLTSPSSATGRGEVKRGTWNRPEHRGLFVEARLDVV